MNTTSRAQELSKGDKPAPVRKPTPKYFLVALAVPLVILLTGIFLLSVTALVGLIAIIVAIALVAGILMAALRIAYQKKSETEPAQWKTRTIPLTSLILILGLSILIFFTFSR